MRPSGVAVNSGDFFVSPREVEGIPPMPKMSGPPIMVLCWRRGLRFMVDYLLRSSVGGNAVISSWRYVRANCSSSYLSRLSSLKSRVINVICLGIFSLTIPLRSVTWSISMPSLSQMAASSFISFCSSAVGSFCQISTLYSVFFFFFFFYVSPAMI